MGSQRVRHDWATFTSLQLYLWSNSHSTQNIPWREEPPRGCKESDTTEWLHFHFHSRPYMTTGKIIALTRRTFVGKVMSLLFNTLSRFIIALLPRRKCLLISRLQSPSVVILEPKKIKSDTLFSECVLVARLCLALCDPMDCSPSGSSVHGILQARILEWVASSFSNHKKYY